MWNPFPNNSLGIWNHQVTSHLAKYCDVLVYCGLFALQKRNKYYHGVHYRGVSTYFDKLVEKCRNNHFRVNRPFYTSILFFFSYAFKVAYDLRRQKCDVIHLYNYPQFIPIIKALNPRIRVILNLRGELLTQFGRKAVRRYLAGTDLIVSPSEFISAKTRSRFPEYASRCETVFNGVDPEKFFPRRIDSVAGTSAVKRLLYVGRLSPEKGVHVLLDAFPKVVDRYPEARLDIVGSEGIMPVEYLLSCSLAPSHLAELKRFYSTGYSVSDLRKRIPQNLASRVTFHGQVSHDELPNYYNSADTYINPTYYESFGMSNIEAMACGTAVVTTPVGAVPEVVEHDRTGILVAPGNSSALADGIIKILHDSPLRHSISKTACERAISCFSWRRACEKLYDCYRC